jgi:hypothetical protein
LTSEQGEIEMKETKHSPGPWRFNKQKVGWRTISDTRGYSLMGDEEYDPWGPSDEADWHLIAAAPELLEALKHGPSTEHLPVGGEQCLCSQCNFVRLRRAAIAKATGEAA